MFEIKDFSIKIKDRYFIQNLSFTLNRNDKMAIIGEEGNGKSTLLKSILGLCDYAEITGKIDTKGNTIGYLEQTLKEEIQQKKVYEILFQNENNYYEKNQFIVSIPDAIATRGRYFKTNNKYFIRRRKSKD